MNSGGGHFNGNNWNNVNQDDLKNFKEIFAEANVEMHSDALNVIADMLRSNIPPDEIYSLIKQIAPVCGLLKKFKLKPQRSTTNQQDR